MQVLRKFSLIALLFAFGANMAEGHPGHEHVSSRTTQINAFQVGLMHPLFGLDHLLALLAVGMLSAQYSRMGVWTGPACFLLGVTIGGIFGTARFSVGTTEVVVAISVLLLGVTLVAKKMMPQILLYFSFLVFGFFHGHAHGTEVPQLAEPGGYVTGFMLGSLLLLCLGLGLGSLCRKLSDRSVSWCFRVVGGAISFEGLFFLVQAV